MNLIKFTHEIRSFDKELKWAVIFSVGMVAWVFMERIFGLHDQHLHALQSSRHAVMVFLMICYIAGLSERWRTCPDGRMLYWDGLVSCVTMTILVLLFMVPVNQFTLTIVSPDLVFNQAQYEIANTLYVDYEVIERNAVANYNIAYFTHFILYGVGLSLFLPLFFVKTCTTLATRFSG